MASPQNHTANTDGIEDNYRSHNIGQDMPDNYPPVGTASGHRRLHIQVLLNAENSAPYYP